MSYINKRMNIFVEGPKTEIVPTRSEARIKNYFSTTDARAWCDTVEQRRQHILEYVAKNKTGICLEKMIPLDSIINTLMHCKNAKMKHLQKKAEYLEKLLEVYTQLNLTPEQKKTLNILIKKYNLNSDE